MLGIGSGSFDPETLVILETALRKLRARHKARCAAADDCKKRLEEKDLRIRDKNNEALRRTAAAPVAHRGYLLRAALIDSVRKRAAAAA